MSANVGASTTESRSQTLALREGIVAGLIGAAVVAGWFLVLDMVIGRLLFTPAALGSALFMGAEDPASVQITAGTVLGYTVIHVGAFVIAGVIFASLVKQAERQSAILLAIVLLFVTTLTLVIGLMAILASWVLAALTWWGIAIGNLLAAAAMAFYLYQRHPGLAAAISDAEERAAAEDGTAGPDWRGPGPVGPKSEPNYRPRGPSAPEGGKPTGG